MMASRPVVPANAPVWIKGWAKENTDFVSYAWLFSNLNLVY